MPLTVIEG